MEIKSKVFKETPPAANGQMDRLEIIYFTDPLCCWSWSFEPQWRRFLYEFREKIQYRYCMGGLLPSWNIDTETLESITNPFQMGPVWVQAKKVSGMPIEQGIWMEDPPSSSYPACIAVKSAGLQSQHFEEVYLRLLREAVMIKGENISKRNVLLKVADRLAALDQKFNARQFRLDFKNDKAMEAFRKDLKEVRFHHISRFPTLVVKNGNKIISISGYRRYSALMEELRQFIRLKDAEPIDPKSYKAHWGFMTEKEMDVINVG